MWIAPRRRAAPSHREGDSDESRNAVERLVIRDDVAVAREGRGRHQGIEEREPMGLLDLGSVGENLRVQGPRNAESPFLELGSEETKAVRHGAEGSASSAQDLRELEESDVGRVQI